MPTFEARVFFDQLSAQLTAQTLTDSGHTPPDVDDEGTLPAELRRWLVDLRLLNAVPFAYLVADTELLPEESIRWFYLDRRWTDALVMGALSVGTVNSDDRLLLAGQYDALRAELDREERQVRRPAGAARLEGDGGPVSGFLLRSQLVSGWPGLHVRGYASETGQPDDAIISDEDSDPNQLRLLRLERLAPAVLLCLFDGIPEVVHVEEPRQGVQFGFEPQGHPAPGDQLRATLRPRHKDQADIGYYPESERINLPFRGSASGVVDIKALERQLDDLTGTGATDGLDSAEYALQLLRFPFRQVFGKQGTDLDLKGLFKPVLTYRQVMPRRFR